MALPTETDWRFAKLLSLALERRLFRYESEDGLFEIVEVRFDGRVRLKPYPARAPDGRGDLVVDPTDLVNASHEDRP